MKRVLFALLAFCVPSLLLLGAVELGLRYRMTGGLVPAIRTFMPAREKPAGWLIADAELGYRLNPALPSFNSLGIRHREITAPTPGDPPRFVVLGDSVAWDEHGFVEQVADRLQDGTNGPMEIINAAVPGYTTYQERMLFEHRLSVVSPRFVLLQYCLNDNHRFLHKLDEGGQWVVIPELHQRHRGREASWLPTWIDKSYIVQRLRWILRARVRQQREAGDPFPWRHSDEFGNAWIDATWGEQESQIRAIRDLSAESGARFAIVLFPLESQLSKEALELDRAYTLTPQRKLAEIATRLDIPLLDLQPAFLASSEGPLFRDGLHLTAAGHDVAARQLMEFIESLGWLGPTAALESAAQSPMMPRWGSKGAALDTED
jgi:lysophospholipase L1-like esterase